MKRATALIILLSMLLSAAACGDVEEQSDVSGTADDNSTETAAAEVDETDRTSIPDNLPEYNFDGREFTILTINNSNDPIRGNDEQNEIRTVCPGLVDLVRVDDEVLAQHRD